LGAEAEGSDLVKLKVTYDTGPIILDISDAEVAALVLRKEREIAAVQTMEDEKARQKRKLLSVEVV
jgi:hypothetical protein